MVRFPIHSLSFTAIRNVATCIFCLLALCAISAATAAAPVEMITPIATAKFRSAADPAALEMAQPAGIKTGTMPVVFNTNALHTLEVGDEAMLSLPNGKQYALTKLNQTSYPDGSRSWVGYLRDYGKQYLVIATTGEGGTFASITTPDEDWSIVPGKGGSHDFLLNATSEAQRFKPLTDTNDTRVSHTGPDQIDSHGIHPVAHEENRLQRSMLAALSQASLSPALKVAPTPSANIDVLVVVTRGFADFHGANLLTRINQLFASTNAAYVTSEAAITVTRVGPVLIRDYDDTISTKEKALTDIVNNTGVFADLESYRASVGADLVALLRNINDGGIAYLGQVGNLGTVSEFWNNPRFMYSVTGICNFSSSGVPICDAIFAHELGHNMGLQHDRSNAGASAFGTRPYSFGWKISTNTTARDFRTIMSYAPPNRRVLVFSNPNIFLCNPAGWTPADACGNANTEDNVRVLNENRFMLQNMKSATNAAVATRLGLVAQKSRTPGVAGTTTLKVFRLGDGTGAASVNFATANGTAVAGVDYIAANGTLSWSAGDLSSKTIAITTLTSSNRNDRTFTVTLSGAVGPAGTSLVTPTSTTLTLTGADLWPSGATLPAGWTQFAAANQSWTVVNSDSQEGTFSLKSAPIADNQLAAIEFTKAVGNGNMTFYRKISSEDGFDFFDVFVDDVMITAAAASGEVDWTLISVPLTAGVRKIRFSYSKDNIIGSGEDAAWIDRLSLPPVPNYELSQDGKSDLVLANVNGSIFTYLMNGLDVTGGGFALGAGTGWSVSHVADLNGDARADLVLKHTDGSIFVYLMNGSAVSGGGLVLGAGTGWSVSHAGDFNGDGKADLLLRHTDGSVYLYLMNGATVSGGALLVGANNQWQVSHLADLNGDGKKDLLFRNTNGSIFAFLMNGSVVSGSGFLLGSGTGWSVNQIGDLNGDAKEDLILRNVDGSVYVYMMDGLSVYGGALLLGTNAAWNVTHTSDLNADGKADLIFRNADGSVFVYLMNGPAFLDGGFAIGPGTIYSVTHVGDLNGDGQADLVLKGTDGSIYGYLMNGKAPATGRAILGPGTGWSVVPNP